MPAPQHGAISELLTCCCYWAVLNLVDYPSGAVPVGYIQPEEATYSEIGDDIDQSMKNIMNGS